MFSFQIQTRSESEVFGLKVWKEQGGDVTISWGNGTTYSVTQIEDPEDWTGLTQSYPQGGTYSIVISGTSSFRFNLIDQYKNKITKILSWGTNVWQDGDFNFSGCQNLDILCQDTPDFTQMTSLVRCFDGCSGLIFTQSSINNWNMSSISNINFMFRGCGNLSCRIDNWDVSNISGLISAFEGVQFRMGHGLRGIHPLKKWKLSDPSLANHFETLTRNSGSIREYNSFVYPSFLGNSVGGSQSYLWIDVRFTCKPNFIGENQGDHTFKFYRGITQSLDNRYTGYNDQFILPIQPSELPPDPGRSFTYSYQISNSFDYIITPDLRGSSTQSHIIYLDNTQSDVHVIKASYDWSKLPFNPLPGINNTDVLRAQRIISQVVTENDPLILKSIDVNNSGTRTGADTLQISQFTAQNTSSFSAGVYVLHPATFSISELSTKYHPVLGDIPYLNLRIRRIGNV